MNIYLIRSVEDHDLWHGQNGMGTISDAWIFLGTWELEDPSKEFVQFSEVPF